MIDKIDLVDYELLEYLLKVNGLSREGLMEDVVERFACLDDFSDFLLDKSSE